MTDKEVLEALLRGEKITSKHWDKGSYLYLDENNLRYDDGNDVYQPEIFNNRAKIYKESVKQYNFREALDMIYEGKIMVSPEYPLYYLKNDKICYYENDKEAEFTSNEINSDEWTEYKE